MFLVRWALTLCCTLLTLSKALHFKHLSLLVENLCFYLSHQASIPLEYLHLDTSLPSMLGLDHIGEFSNYLSTFSMTAQKSELLISNIFHFLWYLSWYIYSVFQTHTISWRIGKYFLFLSCNFSSLPTFKTSLKHFLLQMPLHFLDVSLSHKSSNTPAERAEILVCLQTLKEYRKSGLPWWSCG